MKIKAEKVLARELELGDLFSIRGPEYWDNLAKRNSIGESVYIRTATSATFAPDPDEPMFRITIEK